jgi:hypothetical protein
MARSSSPEVQDRVEEGRERAALLLERISQGE